MSVTPEPTETSVGPGPWRALPTRWGPPNHDHLVYGDDWNGAGAGAEVTVAMLVPVSSSGWYDRGELAAIVEKEAATGNIGDGRPEARRQAWIDSGGLERQAVALEAERARIEALQKQEEVAWTVTRSSHCSGIQTPHGSFKAQGEVVRVDDLVGDHVTDPKVRGVDARDRATPFVVSGSLIPHFCAPHAEAKEKVRELGLTLADREQAALRYRGHEEPEANDKYLLALAPSELSLVPQA